MTVCGPSVRSFSSRYSASSFGFRAVSLYAPKRLMTAATRLLSLFPLRFFGVTSSRHPANRHPRLLYSRIDSLIAPKAASVVVRLPLG